MFVLVTLFACVLTLDIHVAHSPTFSGLYSNTNFSVIIPYLKSHPSSPHISSFLPALFSTRAFNMCYLYVIIHLPLLKCKLYEGSDFCLLFIAVSLTLPQHSHLDVVSPHFNAVTCIFPCGSTYHTGL